MKRLTHVIPLSAIAESGICVCGHGAQGSPDQYGTDQYGTGQYGTEDQYSTDQNTQTLQFRLVTVNIQPWGFYRAHMPVEPKTTVKWINMDTKPQTVTADDGSFDSGVLQRGQSFSFKFDELGTWTYHSETTPTMTGSVIVREVAPATEPTQLTDDTTT